MKSTVDLTADRSFPDEPDSHFFNSLFRVTKSITTLPIMFSKIPWNKGFVEVGSDSELSPDTDMIFPTGSVKDIKHRIQLFEVCSDRYCDRCGRYLKIPWRTYFSLCNSCEKQLKKEYGVTIDFPWDTI